MNDMNIVAINGRLTKDAELKYTNGGMAIATLSLASNRSVKKGDKWEDEANFFECTMFGKSAEAVKQYLTKGQQVSISGELRQERWEKDGQKNSRVTIIVNHLQLVGGKQTHEDKPQSTQGQKASNPKVVAPEDFVDDSFEIPF
jgi:single-strand DNA-binding protein